MKELNVKYHSDKDYRELFKTMLDASTCEDHAVGITNDDKLIYAENKLMNNSSAYWVQSVFYSINAEEFCALLKQARSRGYIEKAIQKGQTTEEELKKLSDIEGVKVMNYCPNCGKKNNGGRYCSDCGSNLITG